MTFQQESGTFAEDSYDSRKHHLQFEYLSALGDLDILQERYDDVVDDLEYLLAEKKARASWGITLGDDLSSFLEQAAIQYQIQQLQAKVEQLRSHCVMNGFDPDQYHFEKGLVSPLHPDTIDGVTTGVRSFITTFDSKAEQTDNWLTFNSFSTVALSLESQTYQVHNLRALHNRHVRVAAPGVIENDDESDQVDDMLSPSYFPKITRNPPRENKRRTLRVIIEKKEYLSCPNSGSSKNIMSKAFAEQEGFLTRRKGRAKDFKRFQIGNGKYIWSIGRVSASVQILGLPLRRKKRSFYIIENCPVPVIMGAPFLSDAEIMTKNRHVLESCPDEWLQIPPVLWIGTPQNRIKCSLDGHNLVAVADTGSDLNLMSLSCATRGGFGIDGRKEVRRSIQLADGTHAETVGQVYVRKLELDWRRPEFYSLKSSSTTSSKSEEESKSNRNATKPSPEDDSFHIFHVLPGLPTDLVFGWDLLEATDAFNVCSLLMFSQRTKVKRCHELNVLIDLRKLPFRNRFLKRRKGQVAASCDPKERHDDERYAELGRRSRKEDEIRQLPLNQQEQARGTESRKARAWDMLHVNCVNCSPV